LKKILIAFALVMALILSGCSSDSLSDPAYQTLRYEGGDTGGSKFKECVDEGEKLVSNDKFYSYPKTQREAVWDTNHYEKGGNSADYPDLVVLDKDGREVFIKMKVSFFLNTSCEPVEANGKKYPGGTIQAFHELVGKTRNAYFDTSGDGNGYGSGWLWAMNNYISTPVTDFVSKAVRPQQVETLYSSIEAQETVEQGLRESMAALVNGVMETDLQFYQNFTVSIYKVTPDAEYLQLIKDRENAQILADTAQANSQAQVAQAQAEQAVAEAKALVKQAEIAGYGGFENYQCIYLADKGLNCAQPQYIVGGTK